MDNPFLLINPDWDDNLGLAFLEPHFNRFWWRKEAAWRVNHIPCDREIYVRLFLFFKGRCGSCLTPWQVFGRLLATDHSHVTGELRGLLCARCNQFLGRCEVMEGLGVKTRLSMAQRTYLARCKRFWDASREPDCPKDGTAVSSRLTD